jgi:hypothetical protein
MQSSHPLSIFKSFPFDAQKLEVGVHPFIDQQQYVSFVPSQLPVWTATEFSTYSSLESLAIQVFNFQYRLRGHQFGGHAISEARFDITVERRYGFYLWKVFLPLLLMVVVSWSVFWFDPPEASSQVTIAVTTILTIIAFALAISLTLPRVPYLTLADGFFLTCYVFAFVTMAEVTAVHVAYRNERRKLAMRTRHTARWLVPTAFVIINSMVMIQLFDLTRHCSVQNRFSQLVATAKPTPGCYTLGASALSASACRSSLDELSDISFRAGHSEPNVPATCVRLSRERRASPVWCKRGGQGSESSTSTSARRTRAILPLRRETPNEVAISLDGLSEIRSRCSASATVAKQGFTRALHGPDSIRCRRSHQVD